MTRILVPSADAPVSACGMGPFHIERLATPAGALLGPQGVVAVRCYEARTLLSRSIGLLGTAQLPDGVALWLEPCASVHTMFLRPQIGCVFLDADGVVVRVADPLPRWRMASARGARVVVEASAGMFCEVRMGDLLTRVASERP